MPDNWQAPNGFSLNAVYGYTRFLIDLLAKEQPQRIFAAFDESLGSCFRNEIYPDYKCSRELPDEGLAYQLQLCQQISNLLGVTSKASSRFEADDLLATVAAQGHKRGVASVVVSADKDLSQILINDDDCLYDYGHKAPIFTDEFLAEQGVHPSRWAEVLALTGDSSDDIPGVPGVGVKTAVKMLVTMSFTELMAKPESLIDSDIRGAKGLVAKLTEYKTQIELAYQLTQLKTDASVDITWRQTQWAGVDETAKDFLQQLGLMPLVDRIDKKLLHEPSQ